MKFKRNVLSKMALLLSVAFIASSGGAKELLAAGYTPSEFTIANHYNYRATAKFEFTVDTLEAWVNVPSNSLGGVVMGTYDGYNNHHDGFNLEVDALGRIKYVCNAGRFSYTFENSNVMDGQWHHLALVRDDPACTLSLYVDGALNEAYAVKLLDTYPQQMLYIGTNPCFWNVSKKNPLEGYVRQITVYSGPISAERILQDMENEAISSNDTNATLLGNWYFGERWTERTIEDTSPFNNDCVLETYEKYVGVADHRDYDYSFLILPDVQCMNRYKHQKFSNLIDWIVDHKDSLKAKFLLQVGDLSDVGTVEDYYRTCAEVMNKLNGHIPWSFVPGNHDYDDNATRSRSTNYFNTYFPYSIHSTLPGFAGAYEAGKMENTYYLYNVGGIKYCVINLEFGPRMEILRWANRLCEKYHDHRVIVQTHAYMDSTRQYTSTPGAADYAWKNYVEYTTPTEFYEYLVKRNKNIFMAVGGHHCADDIVYVQHTGDHGNKINSFLIDNQGTIYGNEGIGEDTVAIFKVNESRKTMSVSYYSPSRDAVYNIQNQFEFYFGDAANPTVGL